MIKDNTHSSERFKYDKVFKIDSGKITTRISIRVSVMTMGPGLELYKGHQFAGVNFLEHCEEDIFGYIENGILVIKGFYTIEKK